MSSLRTILLAAAALVLVTALSACGSSSNKSASAGGTVPSGVQTPTTESLTGGKRGGTLNEVQVEDFEHLDPGQSYFQVDYQITSATQRSLYAYKPNTFSNAVPDLAEAPAQFADANKLVTIKIRKGVHFSPPVNREVTAADVVYAFERVANPNVGNPYYPGYLNSIEGMKKANGGPIPGVKAIDKYTLQIKLTEPQGPIVVASTVLPYSAPVPPEYAKRWMPRSRANTRLAWSPRGRTCSGPTAKARSSESAIRPASRRRSCAIPTGTRARISVPRTWIRSTSQSAVTRT